MVKGLAVGYSMKLITLEVDSMGMVTNSNS